MDLDQAISLDPQNFILFKDHAITWFDKGDFDCAISDYNQTVSLNRQNASAYSGLSWLCATSKNAKYRDGNLAVQYAEKVLKFEPNDFNLLDTVAAAYARSGDFYQAISTQEKSNSLSNPSTR